VFRPARHGNTKTFPHAYLYATDRDAGSSSNDPCVARFPPRSHRTPTWNFVSRIHQTAALRRAQNMASRGVQTVASTLRLRRGRSCRN
jgi:hypothetical protein